MLSSYSQEYTLDHSSFGYYIGFFLLFTFVHADGTIKLNRGCLALSSMRQGDLFFFAAFQTN